MTLHKTSFLVLLGAALAAPPLRAQLNPRPGPTPTAVLHAMPKSIGPAVSPGLAARLSAAGLKPDDAQLKAKLAALNESSRRRLGGNRGGISTQVIPGKGGYGDKNRVTRFPDAKGQQSPAAAGPPSLEIVSAFLSPWDLDATLRVKAPKFYGAGEISHKVSGPCGLEYSGPMSNGGGLLGCCGLDGTGGEIMYLTDNASRADKWRLGATPGTVTLTLSASGLPSVSKTFTGVTGAQLGVKITLTVDSAAPFLGSNAAGLQASNANFGGSSPRSSDGEPWASTTGQDTLGLGAFLGKGFKVVETKIVAATSKLDAPGNTAPENAYRYAKVKTKPDADRLQTVVEWMYGPGESLSYTIEWTLVGPLGQRALSTMPVSGPCDS